MVPRLDRGSRAQHQLERRLPASGQRRQERGKRLAHLPRRLRREPRLHCRGLYRGEKTANGKHYLGGWIVLPDGRQRDAVKGGTTIVASPTLTPTKTSVDVSGAGTLTVCFTDPISHF